MWLCGLVDRLSAYKPGFRWLNPGVIGEKNDPLKKIDVYIVSDFVPLKNGFYSFRARTD